MTTIPAHSKAAKAARKRAQVTPDLPLITRTEHNERLVRGEKASGRYAFICTYFWVGSPVTHVVDVRDENDEQIDYFGVTSAKAAQTKARAAGATYTVSEF